MKTLMKLEDLSTISQLSDFSSGTQAVAFVVISNKDDCYRWMQKTLVKFCYLEPSQKVIYPDQPRGN